MLASLRCRPWAISWCRPWPRLPPLLQSSCADLGASADWKDLLDAWKASPEFAALFSRPRMDSPQRLSSLLMAALTEIVALAGGWTTRTAAPRPAYASTHLLKLQSAVMSLARCESHLRRETGVGSFSTPLLRLLSKLEQQGLAPPTSSRSAILA